MRAPTIERGSLITGAPRIGPGHYAGIFVVSLAVLAYQVLLTRMFSVITWYHFAFAGISLAMLGLTIGAERVYLHPDRYLPTLLPEAWAQAATSFALSSVACVLWFVAAPVVLPEAAVLPVVIGSLILFAIPFTYSGVCVTLLLTRSPLPVGRLYAADLIGAAVGCILIVGLLFVLDPIGIVFGLASVVAWSGRTMALAVPVRRRATIISAVLAVACLAQGVLYIGDAPHLRPVWAKGHRETGAIFERWNALSRISVYPYSNGISGEAVGPFGWGFGHPQTAPITQYRLAIDAEAGTVVTHFDGNDLSSLSYLGNDVINAGYLVRPSASVAVVGVGGGRDVLSALVLGAKRVIGIELNPAIFEVLAGRFAAFTGHLDARDDVHLVNAEARSWLTASKDRFDMIQISLIDTWAATAAGGLTMSENRLYTTEAWDEFFARLTDDGVLSVSRWFDPVSHKAEFYRLLSLAAETLKGRGVPESEVRAHILAFGVDRIVTVLVSRSPFSAAEVMRARSAASAQGFELLVDPDHSWDEISGRIASGRASVSFYDGLDVDVTAPTDNRPFFFYTWKPLRGLFHPADAADSIEPANGETLWVIGALLASTFLCVCAFVIAPLGRVARSAPVDAMLPHLGYFAGIGLGFMLIEISQLQRLIVFLGSPIYGLTVLLFTLLLFGGIGSFTVRPEQDERDLWRRPALCLLMLSLVGLLTPFLADSLRASGVVARILASVALLAPAGFGMGMMFPTGMALSRRFREHQAWFWGVNGTTSVFASVLGTAVSMAFGIAQAYWLGVACYAVCLALVIALGRVSGFSSRSRPTEMTPAIVSR